jgi:hypothetical protein
VGAAGRDGQGQEGEFLYAEVRIRG